MEAPNTSETPEVLRSAWKRYADLDATATKLTTQHRNYRWLMMILGIIATILAVTLDRLTDLEGFANNQVIRETLQTILIILPISISLIAAYINKFLGNGEWLTLRAAAEEILKEIYLYRTILQGHPDRAHWLSHRMITIMRRVYKSMSGQLVLENFAGSLPPYYSPDSPYSDPGFCDLDGDEYMSYRLIEQRNWHRDRISQRQRERKVIQVIILSMGALGSLLAALDNNWIAWVAVTAAIASALTGWEQLRGLDETIMIYSRVTMELTIVRDEWESIPRERRGRNDFVRLVRESEEVMWAQNQQYVATMQDVLAASEGDDAHLVEGMIKTGRNPMDVIQNRADITAALQMQEASEATNNLPGVFDETLNAEIAAAITQGHNHEVSELIGEEFEDTVAHDNDFEPIGIDVSPDPLGRKVEEIMGEADAMQRMMASAEDAQVPEMMDEVFPHDEGEDVQKAIEDVFQSDEENSMIEEALSGFIEDEIEDDEIKG